MAGLLWSLIWSWLVSSETLYVIYCQFICGLENEIKVLCVILWLWPFLNCDRCWGGVCSNFFLLIFLEVQGPLCMRVAVWKKKIWDMLYKWVVKIIMCSWSNDHFFTWMTFSLYFLVFQAVPRRMLSASEMFSIMVHTNYKRKKNPLSADVLLLLQLLHALSADWDTEPQNSLVHLSI
jgi:hypothetical protein